MRLSDIMSAAGLSSWAELGLIISFVTFTGVALWVLFRRSASWERARYLPLEDDRSESGDPR
jgi:hypothetical protein